ncbi:MAG: hypothetical protein CVU94_02650 [Firmicutes bacterium HGW-Firmicutes-19]|nr:MAG: hypothetical protein CVU94_02650 [Firmicutes bacterium HGW-Firmicutes-19]
MNKAIQLILVVLTLFFTLSGCTVNLKNEQLEEDILRNAVLIRNSYTDKTFEEVERIKVGDRLYVTFNIALQWDKANMEGTAKLEYLLKDNKYSFIKSEVEVTKLIPVSEIDLVEIGGLISERMRNGLMYETKKITGELPIEVINVTNISDTQQKIEVTEKYNDEIWSYQANYQVLATFSIDKYWEYQLIDATVFEKVDWNGDYRIVFDNPENFSDYGERQNDYKINEVIDLSISGEYSLKQRFTFTDDNNMTVEVLEINDDCQSTLIKDGVTYQSKPIVNNVILLNQSPRRLRLSLNERVTLNVAYDYWMDYSNLRFMADNSYDMFATMTKIQ